MDGRQQVDEQVAGVGGGEQAARGGADRPRHRAVADRVGGHLQRVDERQPSAEQCRQRAGHLDHRLHDGACVRVGGQVADEGLVNLQLLYRKAAQVGQAGIARAKVVDGKADALREEMKKIYGKDEIKAGIKDDELVAAAKLLKRGVPIATPVFDGAAEAEIRGSELKICDARRTG